MSKFFTSSTVDDLIELAKKPVDYSSFDDINALHHMRHEASCIIHENDRVSDSVRASLESIVSLINDEIDKSRGL
tara:strand:+ start:240 stop:464 length:225 start_codon:yes stop_codon:yes gene_type:complete